MMAARAAFQRDRLRRNAPCCAILLLVIENKSHSQSHRSGLEGSSMADRAEGSVATEVGGSGGRAAAHGMSEAQHAFVLRVVQPGLAGLMDGSVSTLAPIFAAAFATGKPHIAFIIGLSAAVGAGISMA